jgi:hypothetical protein
MFSLVGSSSHRSWQPDRGGQALRLLTAKPAVAHGMLLSM